MAKIYDFIDPCLDEDGKPLPFSGFNHTMIAINSAYACEQMGLTNSRRLAQGYIDTIVNPRKTIKP